MPPIPFWVATTIAPEATAQPGLMATITMPQPTWADPSFIYTVQASDTEVPLAGDPTVDGDGNVTLTVEDLVEGDEYTFKVTVSSSDGTIRSTSLATAAITAGM